MLRQLTTLAIASIFLTVIVPPSRAAESVDQAVSQIAERFVAARKTSPEPMRLAVTAFAQSDGKSNQFTSLLMIALTGKMVEYGGGTFKVIERAQLENALSEIQLSEVPIFDRDTAQELGKFLGVDGLVVGEITPLSDLVRIDARLIAVGTIETLEQASVWVPLTPTLQKQLDTPASIRRPRIGDDTGPDMRNGVWSGIGQCGEAAFGVAIAVVVNPDNTLTAMQTYFPLKSNGGADLQSGVLSMEGTIDPDSGEFALSPSDWIFQPEGHVALGFSGQLDVDRGEIRAKYAQEGCGEVNLKRLH